MAALGRGAYIASRRDTTVWLRLTEQRLCGGQLRRSVGQPAADLRRGRQAHAVHSADRLIWIQWIGRLQNITVAVAASCLDQGRLSVVPDAAYTSRLAMNARLGDIAIHRLCLN